MPFFTNSGAKIAKVDKTISPTTYSDADYYIANTPTKAAQWQIDGVENSIDTSKQVGENGPNDYDGYYNKAKAAKLFIKHIPTGYSVSFPAILTTYAEAFTPSFGEDTVYGRMDPIQKYKNTKRTISLGFNVVAYDEDHAHRNLHALSALVEFLYPVYDEAGTCVKNADGTTTFTPNASVIREAPLLRVRFANLIQKNVRNSNTNDAESNVSYINDGLLVAPSAFTFTPSKDAGYFFTGKDYLFPKEIAISMNFTVLHEETPGWIKGSGNKYEWIGKLANDKQNYNGSTDFPWGNDPTHNEPTPAPSTAAEAQISSNGFGSSIKAAETD